MAGGERARPAEIFAQRGGHKEGKEGEGKEGDILPAGRGLGNLAREVITDTSPGHRPELFNHDEVEGCPPSPSPRYMTVPPITSFISTSGEKDQ